jgi:hypothetical protein
VQAVPVVAEASSTKPIDAPSGLFPLRGFTMGKTTMADLKLAAGGQCEPDLCRIGGINFWFHDHKVFDNLYLTYTDPMPKEWRERLGFEWKLSYNAWKSLLEHRNFQVFADEPPKQVDYMGGKALQAKIIATRVEAVRAEVELDFNYHEGTASSPETLYSISVQVP